LGILQAWCLLVPFTFDNTDCNHPYGYFMVTCMIVISYGSHYFPSFFSSKFFVIFSVCLSWFALIIFLVELHNLETWALFQLDQ
jgi:hypothetical protein